MLCSFCGKTQSLVDQLIDGPDVCICNECVDRFRAILDEGSASPVPAPAPDALALSATAARISAELVVTANRIARAERRLAHELGRQPTAEEIAAASGIEPDELESIKRSIAELVTATNLLAEAAPDPASAIRLRGNLEHRRQRGEPFSRAWPLALRDALAGLPPGDAASWRRTFNATRDAWAASYSGLPGPS